MSSSKELTPSPALAICLVTSMRWRKNMPFVSSSRATTSPLTCTLQPHRTPSFLACCMGYVPPFAMTNRTMALGGQKRSVLVTKEGCQGLQEDQVIQPSPGTVIDAVQGEQSSASCTSMPAQSRPDACAEAVGIEISAGMVYVRSSVVLCPDVRVWKYAIVYQVGQYCTGHLCGQGTLLHAPGARCSLRSVG